MIKISKYAIKISEHNIRISCTEEDNQQIACICSYGLKEGQMSWCEALCTSTWTIFSLLVILVSVCCIAALCKKGCLTAIQCYFLQCILQHMWNSKVLILLAIGTTDAHAVSWSIWTEEFTAKRDADSLSLIKIWPSKCWLKVLTI